MIGGPLIRTLDRALRFLECGQVEQAKVSIERLNLSPASRRGIVPISDAGSPFFGKDFNPVRHPRWPAGSADSVGGQFRPTRDTSVSGDQASVSSQAESTVAQAKSLSECIEECWQLLERPLPAAGSDKNRWDFEKCLNACRGRFT